MTTLNDPELDAINDLLQLNINANNEIETLIQAIISTQLNAEAPGTNESTKTASKGNQSLAEEDDNELEEVLRMSVESKAETESRQMETALALSLESTPKPINQFSTEDEMVDRALAMSLEGL